MLLRGQWLLCTDGIARPILHGAIETASGTWERSSFLLDIGADRTVFNADILTALRLRVRSNPQPLAGVGGAVSSVVVRTRIQLQQEGGPPVVFRGEYAGFLDNNALDMSVLGRDVTNLFAVIADHPGDFVGLLGQRHRYRIEG